MFRNYEELQETLQLLERKYKNYWTVYKPFRIEENSITFEGDAYFDPILTLLSLSDRGIINVKVAYAGSETDKMIITGVNIEALRALSKNWPQWDSVKQITDQLGYTERKENNAPDNYIIEEGEKLTVISNDTWNIYWQIKNAEPNAWNMPTADEVYKTVGFFTDRRKNIRENETLYSPDVKSENKNISSYNAK